MREKYTEEIGRRVIKMLYEAGKTEDEINQLLFEEVKKILCNKKYRSHIKKETLQELMDTTYFKDLKPPQ